MSLFDSCPHEKALLQKLVRITAFTYYLNKAGKYYLKIIHEQDCGIRKKVHNQNIKLIFSKT